MALTLSQIGCLACYSKSRFRTVPSPLYDFLKRFDRVPWDTGLKNWPRNIRWGLGGVPFNTRVVVHQIFHHGFVFFWSISKLDWAMACPWSAASVYHFAAVS